MNAHPLPPGQAATVQATYSHDGRRVLFQSDSVLRDWYTLDELDALEQAIRIAGLKLRAAAPSTVPAHDLAAFSQQQRRLEASPS